MRTCAAFFDDVAAQVCAECFVMRLSCGLERAGLAWATDENTLRDAFSSFGTVTEGMNAHCVVMFECDAFLGFVVPGVRFNWWSSLGDGRCD